MSERWERTCDFCGLVTRNLRGLDLPQDSQYDRHQWDLRLDNHWLEAEDDKGLREWLGKIKISMDACADCATEIGALIRKYRDSRQKAKQ